MSEPQPSGRFEVRLVQADDVDALHALVVANREHLTPWEPLRDESFYTLDHQASVVRGQLERHARGQEHPFVMALDGHLVGRITLSNVVRGPFQSANLGYWVDAGHQGQGLATRALGRVVEVARDEVGLHRIEAGTLLHNVSSQVVLRRCGFEQYGMAPAYLKLAGRWQDHALFQRLLHD
ncbi:GNAT family N-acetyltransferase [Microbacterium sp. ARD31]|uniref:GNAT family N-acetyltransferase n=1 Tax=Microbacterium sp. ARD31 TaxID=2962576 RepID=UPI0028816682|nr:GNAT family N-acetyltransferase [Microbacterium sp. ARD31]MDT0188322.1 GNAT family N-acetyltransferase [Microbacterium sp. ARD31]